MIEENGHRTPYEDMVELQEFVNEGKKRGDPNLYTVGKSVDPRSILALGRAHDPFYAGQLYQVEMSKWFADTFKRVSQGRRMHLRFSFYMAVGEEEDPDTEELLDPARLPDGTIFEKTKENWENWQLWAKWARNMSLVDPDQVIDSRKSVISELHERKGEVPELTIETTPPTLYLPSGDDPSSVVSRASARPQGYSREFFSSSRDMEPSIVELWLEKDISDADTDIVARVCRREDANLIIGSGFSNITTAYEAVQRQRELGKPLRILMLTDFDDAGSHMPVTPARHIEFAIKGMDPKPDIRLHHLGITQEQVIAQKMPRRIPETDKEDKEERRLRGEEKAEEKGRNYRKEIWEAKYGVGTVQLNSLTTPNRIRWFENLLRSTIQSLRDPKILQKFEEKEREAQILLDGEVERRLYWVHYAFNLIAEKAEEEVGETVQDQEEEREAIKQRRQQLRYLMDLLSRRENKLDEEVDEVLEPLEARAERVLDQGHLRLEVLREEVELPVAVAEEPEDAAEGWLFDSRRDYFGQLEKYKEQKFGAPAKA